MSEDKQLMKRFWDVTTKHRNGNPTGLFISWSHYF